MDRARLTAIVDRILNSVREEDPNRPNLGELIPAPYLSLDLDSSRLLRESLRSRGYSATFTLAVRAVSSEIRPEQITKLITAVKEKRSKGRTRLVRSKIGKDEAAWVERTAERLGVRPARVLEAALFLYLRMDGGSEKTAEPVQ